MMALTVTLNLTGILPQEQHYISPSHFHFLQLWFLDENLCKFCPVVQCEIQLSLTVYRGPALSAIQMTNDDSNFVISIVCSGGRCSPTCR